MLKDVLFVPQFNLNLLSVHALVTDSQLIISFIPDYFLIQDTSTKKMIGKGEKLQDLYVLDVDKLPVFPAMASTSAHVNLVSIQTWHDRLGHLSSKILDVLKPQLQYDTSKCTNQEPCYICPLAKLRRLHLFLTMLYLQHHLT